MHKGCFKVFFYLCFSYVGIFLAYCGRVAGVSCRHIVLAAIDFVVFIVPSFGKIEMHMLTSCLVLILSGCFVFWFLFSSDS